MAKSEALDALRAPDSVALAMARVITDEPAAVLLVDLASGTVIYANELASQLAAVALPASVRRWSEAAGLRTIVGTDLEESLTPLDRVAAGESVNGEVITAARGADFADAREQLWVIGTPLIGAPGALADRALVLFLPLRNASAVEHAKQAALDLRHQAVIASEVSFTISDPHAEDDPLVWVNPAFERATGYSSAEVLGRNCRFLQGALTDRATVQRIRDGLKTGGTITETILNYRADGTAFWNRLVISPIFGPDGELTHHVGVQTDVTDRIDADLVRDAALATAQAASRRQQAIASISAALATHSADPNDVLASVPALVTSHFWGWCAVVTLNADLQIDRIYTAYGEPDSRLVTGGARVPTGASQRRDPHLAATIMAAYLDGPGKPILDQLATGIPDDLTEQWPVRDAVSAEEYLALTDATAQRLIPGMADGVAGRSVLAAPLVARGRVVGLMTLSRPGIDELTDAADAAALIDVAMRASTAWDHARLYAVEHDAALTLQRSLLPRLPVLKGFDVAATYIPATSAEVGGDWFDVVDLPGPWLAVMIGDVMGHDIRAAATMGQLRSMVRTLAWQHRQPTELLAQVNDLVRALEPTALATLFYAMIDDPAGYGSRSKITFATAGHIPALLRQPDGTVISLQATPSAPIGVADTGQVHQAEIDLPDRSVLVLFTDGLVERRDRDIDDGIKILSNTLRSTSANASAADVLATITDTLTSAEQDDDTCVLVIIRDDASRD